MISFNADYFDGLSSRPHPITVSVQEDRLMLHCDTFSFSVALKEITLHPFAGNADAIIYLPNNQEIHTKDKLALEALVRFLNRRSLERIARLLESNLRYVAATLLVTISLYYVGFVYGIPKVASMIAFTFPPSLQETMDNQSLDLLKKTYLSNTNLALQRRQQIQAAMERFCAYNACSDFHLLFFNAPLLGPNAFALAGNTVVMTDQLVETAQNDTEITAVFAHEMGHLKERHTLRMMLQGMGSALFLVLITGDSSRLGDIALGIPAFLLQQGYSREMENDADAFALQSLKQANIPPRAFADILLRIDQNAQESASWLSTHPSTKERIQPFLESDM
jgi:Zn-dependent protease with chaperone function